MRTVLVHSISVSGDRLLGTLDEEPAVPLLELPRFWYELEQSCQIYANEDYLLCEDQAPAALSVIQQLGDTKLIGRHFGRHVAATKDWIAISEAGSGSSAGVATSSKLRNIFIPWTPELLRTLLEATHECERKGPAARDAGKPQSDLPAEALQAYEEGLRALQVHRLSCQLEVLRNSLRLSKLPYDLRDLIDCDDETLRRPQEIACERLRRAVELAPDWAEAHYFLGLVLDELNSPEEAGLSMVRAAELPPKLDTNPDLPFREKALLALGNLSNERGIDPMRTIGLYRTAMAAAAMPLTELGLRLGRLMYRDSVNFPRNISTVCLMHGLTSYQTLHETLPALRMRASES